MMPSVSNCSIVSERDTNLALAARKLQWDTQEKEATDGGNGE